MMENGRHSFISGKLSLSPTIWPGRESFPLPTVAPKLPWRNICSVSETTEFPWNRDFKTTRAAQPETFSVAYILEGFKLKLYEKAVLRCHLPLRTASVNLYWEVLHMKAIFFFFFWPPPKLGKFQSWNKKIDINKLLKLNSSQSLHMKKWFIVFLFINFREYCYPGSLLVGTWGQLFEIF